MSQQGQLHEQQVPISRFEIELPTALTNSLLQGGKRWILLVSIREFGHSSRAGGLAIHEVRRSNSKAFRDANVIAGLTNQGRKRLGGPSKPEVRTQSSSLPTPNQVKAQPVKQANSVVNVRNVVADGRGKPNKKKEKVNIKQQVGSANNKTAIPSGRSTGGKQSNKPTRSEKRKAKKLASPSKPAQSQTKTSLRRDVSDFMLL